MSAGQVGDSSQSYFIGCRNQRVGPAERDPAVPLRGRVSACRSPGEAERHYSCRDERFEPTMKPRSRTDRGWHLQLERDGCRQNWRLRALSALSKFEWLLRHGLSVVKAAAKADCSGDDDGAND